VRVGRALAPAGGGCDAARRAGARRRRRRGQAHGRAHRARPQPQPLVRLARARRRAGGRRPRGAAPPQLPARLCGGHVLHPGGRLRALPWARHPPRRAPGLPRRPGRGGGLRRRARVVAAPARGAGRPVRGAQRGRARAAGPARGTASRARDGRRPPGAGLRRGLGGGGRRVRLRGLAPRAREGRERGHRRRGPGARSSSSATARCAGRFAGTRAARTSPSTTRSAPTAWRSCAVGPR
jgi:hypothetical protein